ncbi:DUF4352 domain-containing protein [Haloarcula sp. S1CR25-12]|uniref:DUF4352 domain-containing protein n=1 Tax=Haloarcula saliterrae TaxID=2950534 RepID=A0ABU2F9Z8_9EURY|nr:hypothetical protein [Haloarcula sp. S1CR25-12]MDS0258545.1 DUF4352 domain-containing protein [Haloarcula sp. S1CR25-12]
MDRRGYLTGIATTAALGLAGCGGSGSAEVGDSVTRSGMEAAVQDTQTVAEIDGEVQGSNHAATDGTTILMAKLRVRNGANERRVAPWPRSDLTYLRYNDSNRQTLYLSDSFTADGSEYASWNSALVENTDGDYILPGEEATGWEAFSLESAYTDADVAVVIELDTGGETNAAEWQI